MISATTGRRIVRYCDAVAVAIGHCGMVALVVLAVSVCLDVAMRWSELDTEWVFDLNVFALVWLASAGAAMTAVRGSHVTAGLALERLIPKAASAFNIIRFIIIVPALSLIVVTGAMQAWQAFLDHEVTFDLVAWPVWMAQVAIPIGAAAWAVAEIAWFIRALLGERPAGPVDLE